MSSSSLGGIEKEVNRLCEQYAVLQESETGRRCDLDMFTCEQTLELMGKKSSAESRKEVEKNPRRYLDKLLIEAQTADRILQQDESSSSSLQPPSQMWNSLKERIAELIQLLDKAEIALYLLYADLEEENDAPRVAAAVAAKSPTRKQPESNFNEDKSNKKQQTTVVLDSSSEDDYLLPFEVASKRVSVTTSLKKSPSSHCSSKDTTKPARMLVSPRLRGVFRLPAKKSQVIDLAESSSETDNLESNEKNEIVLGSKENPIALEESGNEDELGSRDDAKKVDVDDSAQAQAARVSRTATSASFPRLRSRRKRKRTLRFETEDEDSDGDDKTNLHEQVAKRSDCKRKFIPRKTKLRRWSPPEPTRKQTDPVTQGTGRVDGKDKSGPESLTAVAKTKDSAPTTSLFGDDKDSSDQEPLTAAGKENSASSSSSSLFGGDDSDDKSDIELWRAAKHNKNSSTRVRPPRTRKVKQTVTRSGRYALRNKTSTGEPSQIPPPEELSGLPLRMIAPRSIPPPELMNAIDFVKVPPQGKAGSTTSGKNKLRRMSPPKPTRKQTDPVTQGAGRVGDNDKSDPESLTAAKNKASARTSLFRDDEDSSDQEPLTAAGKDTSSSSSSLFGDHDSDDSSDLELWRVAKNKSFSSSKVLPPRTRKVKQTVTRSGRYALRNKTSTEEPSPIPPPEELLGLPLPVIAPRPIPPALTNAIDFTNVTPAGGKAGSTTSGKNKLRRMPPAKPTRKQTNPATQGAGRVDDNDTSDPESLTAVAKTKASARASVFGDDEDSSDHEPLTAAGNDTSSSSSSSSLFGDHDSDDNSDLELWRVSKSKSFSSSRVRPPRTRKLKQSMTRSGRYALRNKASTEEPSPIPPPEELLGLPLPVIAPRPIPPELTNAIDFTNVTPAGGKAGSTTSHIKKYRIKNAGHLREVHDHPVYCAIWSKFFHYVPPLCAASQEESPDENDDDNKMSVARYLATCAGRNVTVYQVNVTKDTCFGPKSGPFLLKQAYLAGDKDEDFYALAFAGRCAPVLDQRQQQSTTAVTISCSSNSSFENSNDTKEEPGLSSLSGKVVVDMPQLLCAGGSQRQIHVIDPVRRKRIWLLKGHGDRTMDLKTCPTDEWILLSCSDDESVRLWNLKTGAAVAVLAGPDGHRNPVVSVAWHSLGHRIASSGMDNSVKIWDASEGSPVYNAIQETHKDAALRPGDARRIWRAVSVYTPQFSTSNYMHIHCVDCVQFVGDLILSKSVDSVIELWCPILPPKGAPPRPTGPPGKLKPLRSFHYDHGDVWFMRFATDALAQRLAVGNVRGEVYLWTIDGNSNSEPDRVLTATGKTPSAVRCVEFSPCGSVLIATMDDGSVYKWDVKRKK